MVRRNPDFDVALSFAGEDRSLVERVAVQLREMGLRVFYDKHETVTLWGKDLYTHLREVYTDRARYTVMFISKHYRRKLWSNHERESAQARAFRERKEYIVPARLDNTKIPGVLDTTGYVNLAGMSPRKLANLIKEKIGPIERPGYLPPDVDEIWRLVRASTPKQKERSQRIVKQFFYDLSLMTKRERKIFCMAMFHSCRAKLPENVHVSLEYLSRLVHAGKPEILATFARLDSLNFTTRVTKPMDDDDHLGEGEQLEISYYSAFSGSTGYDNRVIAAVVECLAATKCNECIRLAVEKLDFSPLSSHTANPPHR